MKIDLHVHTRERSPCSVMTEEEQIRAAMAAGLHGMAITDHDRLVPRERLARLNEQFAPFKIFTGIEVSADYLHWVVLGLHNVALERMNWNYPDLLRFVRERGGFIFLAHPFRYKPWIGVDLKRYTPDGIEIESTNTPVSRQADIRATAQRHGLALLRNSDGHRPGGVGSYWNELPGPASDDRELIERLMEMKREMAPPLSKD